MNAIAKAENRRTLVDLLNINEERAEKILEAAILLSGRAAYPLLAGDTKLILEKSFERVDDQPQSGNYSCEVVFDRARCRTEGPYIFVGQRHDGKLVVSSREPAGHLPEDLHPFIYLLLACYIGSQVMRIAIGQNFPFNTTEEIEIDLGKLIPSHDIFDHEVNLGEAYLAGAGAVGNAFLYALRLFKVKGKLNIADPDKVSDGNLNRCLLFTEDDLRKFKAEILVSHMQSLFPDLQLDAFPEELSQVPAAAEGGPWLKRLIVAVDSRRARRNLQDEFPGEVFDASTTDIREVEIHHNKLPLEGRACLGCIYYKEENELAREQHVAELLGVSVGQVQQLYIDEAAAKAIVRKYTDLHPDQLKGQSYDTLFKQLCGESKLQAPEDKQVLAPFAFVSALAGALLALKLVEALAGNSRYSDWKASPWMPLNYRLRTNAVTNPECEFCSDEDKVQFAKELWKGK